MGLIKIHNASVEENKGFESDNVSKYASDASFKRLVGPRYF